MGNHEEEQSDSNQNHKRNQWPEQTCNEGYYQRRNPTQANPEEQAIGRDGVDPASEKGYSSCDQATNPIHLLFLHAFCGGAGLAVEFTVYLCGLINEDERVAFRAVRIKDSEGGGD